MKFIFIIYLFLLTFSNNLFAQYQIEPFSVNGKVGVVYTSSLKEFLAPTYPIWKSVKINQNYIAFRDSSDYLIATNKVNLKSITPIKLSRTSPLVGFYESILLHSIQDNKSVLVDSTFQNKYHFSKAYKFIRDFNKSNGFCYAESENLIEIYKLETDYPKLIHNIAANKLTTSFLNKESGKEEVYVFYGLQKIFVFDTSLNLIKTINKSIVDSRDLYYIINPNENRVASGTPFNSQSGRNPRRKNIHKYKKIAEDEERVFFTSNSSSITISTFKDYEVRSKDSKNIVVFKVFKTVKNGRTTISRSNENSFSFLIDEEDRTALLPLKYQNEIGLEINLK